MNQAQRILYVLEGLAQGKVNEREADFFLRQHAGITLEQARKWSAPKEKRGIFERKSATATTTPNTATPSDALDATMIETPAEKPLERPIEAQTETAETPDERLTETVVEKPTNSAVAINTTIKNATERKSAMPIALVIMAIILVSGIALFLNNGTPTGNVILDIAQENITTFAVPITETVTSIRVTGTLSGEGTADILFDTDAGTLVIASITSDDGTPRTDKAGYAQGESVAIMNAPTDAAYYLDDGATSAQVSVPFPAPATDATLLIVSNESGELATYRLPILIGDITRSTAFASVCSETCSMAPANGTLRVQTTGGATLTLTTVDAQVLAQNSPPELVLAFGTIAVGQETTVNLSEHFADIDGDALYFSVGSSSIVAANIDGDTLTMTPIADGTQDLYVYASDLQDLVPATMTIIATAPLIGTPADNATGNGTQNITIEPIIEPVINATINETMLNETLVNETLFNGTLNDTGNLTDGNWTYNGSIALDCSDPDPNKRPESCLNLEAERYFEEDIFLYNVDRISVARFTTIGNLLITGRVHQYSTAQAGSRDFTIGYKDDDFNYIPTIWIDSATGDLHLRGKLHEENANLEPYAGSYSAMNRRGVYMMYADYNTGDMYVRGNVIPYRISIYE